MPVLDGDFEAFVTNLGKYNEGMLVGEWVKLPTTEEEIMRQRAESIFIVPVLRVLCSLHGHGQATVPVL